MNQKLFFQVSTIFLMVVVVGLLVYDSYRNPNPSLSPDEFERRDAACRALGSHEVCVGNWVCLCGEDNEAYLPLREKQPGNGDVPGPEACNYGGGWDCKAKKIDDNIQAVMAAVGLANCGGYCKTEVDADYRNNPICITTTCVAKKFLDEDNSPWKKGWTEIDSCNLFPLCYGTCQGVFNSGNNECKLITSVCDGSNIFAGCKCAYDNPDFVQEVIEFECDDPTYYPKHPNYHEFPPDMREPSRVKEIDL